MTAQDRIRMSPHETFFEDSRTMQLSPMVIRANPCRSAFFRGFLSLLPFLLPGLVQAQRNYVLPQIKVPHPYYFREMYLPQATSGPNALTWSPDGTEIIYSMQGTLWRQKVGTTTAIQLTDG